MGFPCRCCDPCSDKCNLLFEETGEIHIDTAATGVAAPTVSIDYQRKTSTFVWDLPDSPITGTAQVIQLLVKAQEAPPKGWDVCGWYMKLKYSPSTFADEELFDPIDIRGNVMFKKDGKFYYNQSHFDTFVDLNGQFGSNIVGGGSNGNNIAQGWAEVDVPAGFNFDYSVNVNSSAQTLGNIDYQANGGLYGVYDSEAWFVFFIRVDQSNPAKVYPSQIEIEVQEFCILYLGGSTDKICRAKTPQIAAHEHWFRGPIGNGNVSLGFSSVYFQRFFGTGFCNKFLFLPFSHEEEDEENGKTYRYYRSEPYENRNGDLVYCFARNDKCKSFINAWMSTDSEAWQIPEDCSDSSNYLPIWENGLEEEDDFDPDNPVDPIYVFGHEFISSFNQVNWQSRMLGLNFPKSFYRYLDKIEIQNTENIFQSGDIELQVRYAGTPPACGTVISSDYFSIGTEDASDYITPSYANNSIRYHRCASQNGDTWTQLNGGGQWTIKVTGIAGQPATGIYDCPYVVEVWLNWLNDFNLSVIDDDFENIIFYAYFWGGSGFILGQFLPTDPLGLTENWSTFENLTPITKSGGFGGGWSPAWMVSVTDLVLGSLEARGIYVDDF